MSSGNEVGMARRAWLRALLWGAGGLSLLPGCSRGGPFVTCYKRAPLPPGTGPSASLLARWRELGRIWRELSAHARGKYEREDGEERLKALEAEANNALAALPAWPELRALFEERLAHVRRSRYVMATCYEPTPWGPMMPRGRVEQQMTELRRLVDEGKVTRDAAEKAARKVAVEAEYMTQLGALETGNEEPWAKQEALWERYRDGKIVAGEGAQRAGRRVVEFEVDTVGLLDDPAE